jgi:hypothetical protein
VTETQVTSTVWSSSFKESFETYPILETVVIHDEDYKCMACRKSKYRTTREARLSGIPYNPMGFEVSAAPIVYSTCSYPCSLWMMIPAHQRKQVLEEQRVMTGVRKKKVTPMDQINLSY